MFRLHMAFYVTYPSSNRDRRYARRYDTLAGARRFATRLQRPTATRGGPHPRSGRIPRAPEDIVIFETDESQVHPLVPLASVTRTPSERKPKAKAGDVAAWLVAFLVDGDRVPPRAFLREKFRRTDIEEALRMFREYPAFGFRPEDERNPRSPLVRDSTLDP